MTSKNDSATETLWIPFVTPHSAVMELNMLGLTNIKLAEMESGVHHYTRDDGVRYVFDANEDRAYKVVEVNE